jgi:predicted RNase H-like HicB family nuclease
MRTIHTIVFRKSKNLWLALCLENGMVGQGDTQEESLKKITESIASMEEVYQQESDVFSLPIPINELHEFLTFGVPEPTAELYEMRAVYA